jgi:hypothetical protein
MRVTEITSSKTRQDMIRNRPVAYLVYLKSDKARLMPGVGSCHHKRPNALSKEKLHKVTI